MNRTADAVVVGAGIVGAACAYRLAEMGLRVTVLEQGDSPAAGSTGRSAAGVRAQFGNTANILLSKVSIEEYADMPDSGYRPVGYLMIVPTSRWQGHRQGVELQRSLGVTVHELTPDEAQEIVAFDADDIAGCTFCPTDGAVDPHDITLDYLRRARSHRAQVRLSTPLTGITRTGTTWTLQARQGTVETPIVINAAGCWGGQVAALAGLEVPVGPARRNVFVTAPEPTLGTVPMTFDLDSGMWMRSEGDRLIIGRANPDDSGWREGGVDWDWFEPTMQVALHRFPWIADLALDTRASWWGYYEITPDHFPVLGAMPGTEGWLNACGFSGHGVMQAAATGQVIAQEATGQVPFIDIAPLRIERFSDPANAQHDITL